MVAIPNAMWLPILSFILKLNNTAIAPFWSTTLHVIL